FEHGRITTTETKARRLRPLAEKLITKAKRGDLASRRQVLRVVRDKSVVHTLFTEIGPHFETRPGGYTRITKLGPRKGDNAPMAVIELVAEPMPDASGEAETPVRGSATAQTTTEAEPKAEETAEEATAEETVEEPTAEEAATVEAETEE